MFDKLPPGVKPGDVGSENEPDECINCGREIYETGADVVSYGHGIDLFCDENCRREHTERLWYEAIDNDEQLPEHVEEYIKTEMVR